MMVDQYLNLVYFGSSVRNIILAITIFIVSIILLKISKSIIIHKFKRHAELTETSIDDIIITLLDIKWFFYVFISFYLGSLFLTLPLFLTKILNYLILFVLTFYVVRALNKLVDYTTVKIIEKEKQNKLDIHEVDTGVIDVLSFLTKMMLWVFAVIFILNNLGFQISSLIAGLGIGGIAIAFALQNILSDIFASFSIYLDKPFRVGDFIIIGNDMGIVRKIGIKSTRIKTLEGQELIVSNKELTETRVNNYKKMEKRRVLFTIGVAYQTKHQKLIKIPKIMKKIINKINGVNFDRAHLKTFAESSLLFEIVYYINSGDYSEFMDVQQKVNFKILEMFEKEKINIAYPTQTLYVKPQKGK